MLLVKTRKTFGKKSTLGPKSSPCGYHKHILRVEIAAKIKEARVRGLFRLARELDQQRRRLAL